MTPFTSEKILNKVLFIFICVLILFGFIIFTDRILILRQKWQEETNKEKIEKLDVKVDNLSATTTQAIINLQKERSFYVRIKGK